MKVMIGTPTVHGMVAAPYAVTLVTATQMLHAAGAEYVLVTVANLEVAPARTVLAHAFLSDASATHLLFLDSDMAVQGDVFRRLLELRAPIAGAAYPKRMFDLDAFGRSMAEVPDVARAKAVASRFTVGLPPGRIEVRDGIVEVERLGFGCALIDKSLLLRLIDQGLAPPVESRVLRRTGLTGAMHDFFGPLDDAGDERQSEDFAFCSRVHRLGDTPILAYVGPGVGHVGQFTYDAAYLDWLRTRIDPAPS